MGLVKVSGGVGRNGETFLGSGFVWSEFLPSTRLFHARINKPFKYSDNQLFWTLNITWIYIYIYARVCSFSSEHKVNKISSCICQWALGMVYGWCFKWCSPLKVSGSWPWLVTRSTRLSSDSYWFSSAFVSLGLRSDEPGGRKRAWPLTVVRVGASTVTRLFPVGDDGLWLGWRHFWWLLSYTAILGVAELSRPPPFNHSCLSRPGENLAGLSGDEAKCQAADLWSSKAIQRLTCQCETRQPCINVKTLLGYDAHGVSKSARLCGLGWVSSCWP